MGGLGLPVSSLCLSATLTLVVTFELNKVEISYLVN